MMRGLKAHKIFFGYIFDLIPAIGEN